ncbi:MAG: YdhR family protein [Ginsengibacter sp.]
MPQKMLVTKFNYNVSREEYENTVNQLGEAFAAVPGCIWKIWLIDDEKKEAGALYLFEDEAALQNFKASPLVASVLSHPALSNFDLRETDILKDLSAVTRGPL